MSSLSAVLEVVRENRKFLVVSHENPDCDALGSTIAMAFVLRDMGKEVETYNADPVPRYLRFLPDSSSVVNSLDSVSDDVEVVMILDCADISRPGGEFCDFIRKKERTLVFVDHHATNGEESEYCFTDERASSTGVLVYRMIKEMGVAISAPVAECLFSTIVGDTGSFRYSNTYSETFTIAADLVNSGADPERISRFIYDTEPLEKIRLRSLAMDTLEVVEDGKIAFIHVSREMFEETGTEREHAEGLVSLARSVEGVEVAVFLRQEAESRWKVSLRSKEYVDVSRIAESLGGGGHRKASGCRISAPLASAKRTLLRLVREAVG